MLSSCHLGKKCDKVQNRMSTAGEFKISGTGMMHLWPWVKKVKDAVSFG